MSKGTILYVGNYELPDKGASANRVVSNGKLFHKLGYTTAYLGIKKGDSFDGIQQLDGCPHMYEEAYPQGSKEWLIHMYSTKNIEMLVEQYLDTRMIILYNLPFTLLCQTKRRFKNKNIKVVYDCTEWTGVTDGSFVKRAVKWMDEYFIRNYIGKVADGLIVISKMMEKQYQNCKNLVRIPPLVDINDYIWHQKVEKETDKKEFCFAGILDGNKDSVDKIVEAFSLLDNANCLLRIIGIDRLEFDKAYPEMKSVLEQLGEKVLFMGTQSHKETIKQVLGCDYYIFVRQSDRRNNAGFPTKFAESYTCGCPIITTDISDIKDYLTEGGRVVLLGATSAEEIKVAMKEMLQMPQKDEIRLLDKSFHYESYQEKAQKWMEKLYN